MTRNDIAKQLVENAGLKPAQATAVVNSVINSMADALQNGESICIRGFATIEVNERKARQGYNFKEGKAVVIPAHRVLTIKAGKEFSEKLNEGK